MRRLLSPFPVMICVPAFAQSIWNAGTRATTVEARASIRMPAALETSINSSTLLSPFPRDDRTAEAQSLSGTPASGTRALASIAYRVYGNTLRVEADTRVDSEARPPLLSGFGTATAMLRIDLVVPTDSTFSLLSERLESVGGGATVAFYSNNVAVLDRSVASAPIAPLSGPLAAGSIILVTACSAFAESAGDRASSTGTLRFALQIVPSDFCTGDLNGDRVVDDPDFAKFAAAYEVLSCDTPPMEPGCPADLNADGFVDDLDFQLFAVAYDQLICP